MYVAMAQSIHSGRQTMVVKVIPLLVVAAFFKGALAENSRKDKVGPTFVVEPPSRVEFSNTSGTEIRCVADGYPKPKVWWQTREGVEVSEVPSLRYVREDGTIVFSPFPSSDYRQDVHDTVYECAAANEEGTILSREVHVRGVLKQRFSPQVYEDFVVRGNTAVLRCHLPSFVREHVSVDSWIRSDNQIIKVSNSRARSYTVLHSGELLLHEMKERDTNWSYRCQTRHRLTGEMVVSVSAGRVIVTEPHVSTLPRVTFSRAQVRADEGTAAQLPCVAQGNPPPTYRWMKDVSGALKPLNLNEGGSGRLWLNRGTLNFRRVEFSDGGQYLCIVRNSIGERRVETSLIVTAPLLVALVPPKQVLSIGQEATFNCNITGYPIHSVSWKHDALPLIGDSRRRLLSRDVLLISSVRREDRGMYQCFAHNDRDSAQGTAQLSIADVSPSIISAFAETTIHPGQRVSFKCVATGNPFPEVSWFLDSFLIDSSNSRAAYSSYVTEHGHVIAYLNVTGATVEDGGEYSCRAANDVGFASHSARLNVFGPPFVRHMDNVTAVSGKEVTMSCPYGGHPVKGIRWMKDGMILPLNHRQKVSHGGSLTIQSVQRAADQGEYSCTVKNEDGTLSATGSTFLSVVVSPLIDAHFFRERTTVDEGSRAKLMCVVTKGDPPLRFQWLKDGQPFLPHGETTVQTFDDTSIVTFKKVSAADRGSYTCTATNNAESTNMTMQMVVNVPPQWIVEPGNVSAVLGNSVRMDCSASGFPTPSVLWKKLIYTDSAAGDFTYVHSSPRAHRYSNGTLVLSEVEESDAGSYLCQASNGVGAGLSKIVHLKILVPPKFLEPYQSQTVTEGSNTSLKCISSGDPPIDITWKKEKEEIPVRKAQRYSEERTIGAKGTVSEIRIWGVSRNDTGMYSCVAQSAIGRDDAVIQLIVQGPPDAPANVNVTNVTSRSISLQWTVPYNGNSHITGTIVQYKAASDSSWRKHTSQLIVSGTETSTTLRGLNPVTMYLIRIIAENALGKSSPSSVINVTTGEEAPSAAPRDVQVHSTGAQSMKVSWKPPPEGTHNGVIRGYYVGYRPSFSSEPYHFKKVERASASVLQSTYITGLKPFTMYDVVVKAYNSAGNSPKSSKAEGKTLETAPPTSPILHAEAASTSSLDISWKKDSKDKSAITEYMLHYKVDDGNWHQERISSSKERFTLTGLRCGTRYHLYMTASNSLGTGEPSVPVSVRTKGAAPMSPSAAAFLSPSDTSVTLRLSEWQSGGCPILHFVVQYRPKYQNQWTAVSEKIVASTDAYVLRHLTPDREYMLMVTAYSEAGITQGEYQFRTMPAARSSVASPPSFGKRETNQPFYKNVALVIPVVVSSLVLVIVIFMVAVCLRRHATNRRGRLDYGIRKSCTDSLMMSDMSKHVGTQSSNKSSHYAIPTAKGADYAEPYSCTERPPQGNDGLFATIKRHPPRPVYVPPACKQESSTSQHSVDNDCQAHTGESGKWSSQKPVR